MDDAKKCLKCGGVMEKGYMIDRGLGPSVTWKIGEPNKLIKKIITQSTVFAYSCKDVALLKIILKQNKFQLPHLLCQLKDQYNPTPSVYVKIGTGD
jgi:hypothetical protein